jgi:DNA-binding transcriptional regulator YiaG
VSPADLRAALAGLGLSQVGFARIARVDPRTVRKWVAGDRAIPGPVVVLIELLQAAAISGQADEEGGARAGE